MCVCEKCRQRYHCERQCPITVSNYEGINLLANCRNMLSGPPENFSTFVLRSEGRLNSGIKFHIGPPLTRWKRVPNTLQPCNVFCKRHRASFFSFLKVYTTASIASECACGLAVQFSRLQEGPHASFQQEGDAVYGLEPRWLYFRSQQFFFMAVPEGVESVVCLGSFR